MTKHDSSCAFPPCMVVAVHTVRIGPSRYDVLRVCPLHLERAHASRIATSQELDRLYRNTRKEDPQ